MQHGLMTTSGVTLTECRHHWLIEAPSGRTSRGRCKLCGAEREFLNYQSDFPYEGDNTLSDKFPARVGGGADEEEEESD